MYTYTIDAYITKIIHIFGIRLLIAEYNKCGKNSSKDYSKMSDKHEEPLEVVEDGPCINHVDAITHNNFAAPSSSSVVEMEDYYFEDFQ